MVSLILFLASFGPASTRYALWEGGGSIRAGGIKPGRALVFVRLIHWMSRTDTAMHKMHKLRKMNQMHKILMAISAAR
jgi:hypothetical protein